MKVSTLSMDFRLLLEQVGGGVHKRTDENRELLELLQQKAPELLKECPWVAAWIGRNDEVFCALRAMAEAHGDMRPRFRPRPGFPRPWPASGDDKAAP